MKQMTRGLAMLVAGFFLLATPLPAGATTAYEVAAAPEPAAETQAAAAWLLNEMATPGHGDETALLALLRGGFLAGGDAPIASHYLPALQAAWAGGGAPSGDLTGCAMQLLVLTAAGVDAGAALPALSAVFDDDTLWQTEDAADRRALLLAGKPCDVLPDAVLDRADALANVVAGGRNLDGGFGGGGFSSGVADTARMLQALALYRNDGVVQNAVIDGIEWLRAYTDVEGGWPLDAETTAEVLLAMACLGDDRLMDGTPGAAESAAAARAALVAFQREDGSFAEADDTAPDTALTALCTLALVAADRQQAALPIVFDLRGVPIAHNTPPAETSFLNRMFPGLPPLPTHLAILIVVGFAAVVVLVAILVGLAVRAVRRRKVTQLVEGPDTGEEPGLIPPAEAGPELPPDSPEAPGTEK